MQPPLRRRIDHEPGDPQQLRALIVDDDENYLVYAQVLVARFGFKITTCGDGEAALLAIRERRYDLLVVDCDMPRLGGLDLIRYIRADEHHSDVYAVMLTALDNVETKVAALRSGYDDFLTKSAGELEIAAKLSVARRLVARQHRLDATMRELYGLATRDELTGLFNRRYFIEETERLLTNGANVNLILFDLDDFKLINDTLGHLSGDRMLRDLGALFIRRTRQEDFVARYGGDEFVMLVEGLKPAEVEAVAQRIGAEIGRAQWTFGTESYSISVTTGIACAALLDTPTLPKLISAGDQDLYKNKWLRKNPDSDPALYEYDNTLRIRDARVIELTEVKDAALHVRDPLPDTPRR
ncbi:MAG TPA: diguanylate cyclase [Thermoanaerobaculia bacterium]|nr:diguanylate cyclase [Thermoanaerobaculia bacterium]